MTNQAIERRAHDQKMLKARDQNLGHLPGTILRDIARNESAPRDWRKAAVELMIEKGFPEVNHPELVGLKNEVLGHHEAKSEVQSIVESAIEGPIDEELSQGCADGYKDSLDQQRREQQPGPFKASFTTKSFYQDEHIE